MNLIALISFASVGIFFLQMKHKVEKKMSKHNEVASGGCKTSDCLDKSPTHFKNELKVRLLNMGEEGSSSSGSSSYSNFGKHQQQPEGGYIYDANGNIIGVNPGNPRKQETPAP